MSGFQPRHSQRHQGDGVIVGGLMPVVFVTCAQGREGSIIGEAPATKSNRRPTASHTAEFRHYDDRCVNAACDCVCATDEERQTDFLRSA